MIPSNTKPSTAVHLGPLSPFSVYSKDGNDGPLKPSWEMASLQKEKTSAVKRKRVSDNDREAVAGFTFGNAYTDDDILQGRGKGVSKHRGNRRFRKVIKRYCHPYTRAKTNQERRKIVDLVLGEVRNKGRFLELCNSDWVVLSEKKVREKVSQALRYQHRVQGSGTEADNGSACSSASEEEDTNSAGIAAPVLMSASQPENSVSAQQLFGDLTDMNHIEATEPLEEWDIEPVAVEQRPLLTDEEILASVGAAHLALQHQPDNMASLLDPRQEVEDFFEESSPYRNPFRDAADQLVFYPQDRFQGDHF